MDVSPRFRSFFFGQKLNSIGILFLFGCLVFVLLSRTIAFALLGAVACFLTTALFFLRKKEDRTMVLLFLVGLALSLIVFGIQEYKRETLFSQYHQKSVEVRGVVTSSSEESFNLLVKTPFSAKVRVASKSVPETGDVICVTLALSAANSDVLKQENVLFEGTFSDGWLVEDHHFFYSTLGKIRFAIASAFGESREGGFLRAILLSDRKDLSKEDTISFRKTASSHLIAISGLHISQFVGIFLFVMRILGIGERKRAVLMIPVVLFLFFVTSGTISIFRASLMAILPMIATCFRRPGDSVTSLVFAAFVLVCQNIYTLTSASFLLSFSSTLGILVAGSPLCEGISLRFQESKVGKKSKLAKWCFVLFSLFIISVSSFVFSFPFQLLLFGKVSISAPLFALILIPMFSLCLGIGMFTCFTIPIKPIGQFFLWLSRGLVGAFLHLNERMAASSPKTLELGNFSAVVAILMLGILLFLLATRRKVVSVLYLYAGILIFALGVILFA